MTDTANGSIVLVLLQVSILWECDDIRTSPCIWPFSCLPDFVAKSKISIMASHPAWTSSADMVCLTQAHEILK